MSSRSRRRTLSHVEIENFLNVIGSDSEVSLPTKAHKRRSSIIFEKDFDENRVNNASSDKIQAHHDIKSSNSQAVLQKNSTFKPIVENRNAELTDVELIRKYCKVFKIQMILSAYHYYFLLFRSELEVLAVTSTRFPLRKQWPS